MIKIMCFQHRHEQFLYIFHEILGSKFMCVMYREKEKKRVKEWNF